MNKQQPIHDAPLWFFGSIAALFVLVSAPATYTIVSAFHGGGHVFGIILSASMLIALEAGAVGCKLSTLVVAGKHWKYGLNSLTILLLLLTTAANYAYGSDYFMQADDLSPTLLVWRESAWASVAIAVYAGIVPLLLFVFLSLTVERWKFLQHTSESCDLTAVNCQLDTLAFAAEIEADERPEILKLYEQLGSLRKVGKALGISHVTARNRLLELGVTLERQAS